EESLVGNRWMFTGREWLGQVGLYDYRNRVFSPEVGRFLQCDPIRFSAGDINIYRYCHNRYVVLTDPYGLIEWSEAVSFGGQVTFAYGVGGSIGVSVDSTGLNF